MKLVLLSIEMQMENLSGFKKLTKQRLLTALLLKSMPMPAVFWEPAYITANQK